MIDEIAAERACLDLEHVETLLHILIAQIKEGAPARDLLPLASSIRQRTANARVHLDRVTWSRDSGNKAA